MECLETNKICSKYNRKCKTCTLDNGRNTYSMTDYEEYLREKNAKEIFENAIPEECKRCTLLERDFEHKRVKCLYRNDNKCILPKQKRLTEVSL